MSAKPSRIQLKASLLSIVMLAACTGSSGASYGSNDPGSGTASNISGKSDTSGVSAGAALQPPSSASPTRVP